MAVNNYPSNVPSNIVNVFDGAVPFGSDFIYFCADNTSGSVKYEALYREPGSDTYSRIRATRMGDGSYTFNFTEDYDTYEGFSSTHPEYAYSSVPFAGQYHELPSGRSLNTLMLVVICSLCVLKVVFGGIKWVRSRRYRV